MICAFLFSQEKEFKEYRGKVRAKIEAQSKELMEHCDKATCAMEVCWG